MMEHRLRWPVTNPCSRQRGALEMATQETSTDLVIRRTFDYAALDQEAAEHVKAAAVRIQDKVARSLQNIIEIGAELASAKALLGHGLFGDWLRAEFGWSERTARTFLSVAEHFGPRSALLADLAIQPTAAYLLAAPSVPEAARETAFRRAEAGE